MRLAIVNGYSADARSDFRIAGIRQGEDLFGSIFGQLLPEASWDVFFPADESFRGPRLEDYAGFVWTGSSGTIYQDTPGNRRQIELMRSMLRFDRPVWGSCWGLQVATVAAGGQVAANRKRREWMAARRVRLTEAGSRHAMFLGKPPLFDSYVMHLDEVARMPESAKLLATNDHSEVQAFELVADRCRFWGTQYHPEFDADTMSRLIASRSAALLKEELAPSAADLERLVGNLRRVQELVEPSPVTSAAELQSRAELEDLATGLDLHWSCLGATTLTTELSNWVAHALKPSVASRT